VIESKNSKIILIKLENKEIITQKENG